MLNRRELISLLLLPQRLMNQIRQGIVPGTGSHWIRIIVFELIIVVGHSSHVAAVFRFEFLAVVAIVILESQC